LKNESNIAMALRAAYLSLHRQTGAHLATFGVTADQFVCLVILNEQDGISQKELATRATSDPNTIRAMLLLLEKQGLVTREQHASDRRARVVRLTSKGRLVFINMLRKVRPVREKLLIAIGVKEEQTLCELLQRVAEKMA
jgi:DNA-binding MarR family transcriptional regulator